MERAQESSHYFWILLIRIVSSLLFSRDIFILLTTFRQLNLYCFRKLKVHGERGAYSHPNFIRGQKELLVNVRRPRQRTVASSTVRKKSPLLKAGSYDGAEERAIYSSDETRAFKRCKLTGSPFADSSSDGDSVAGSTWLDGGDGIEKGSSGIVGELHLYAPTAPQR